jgi:hypothetical protein
VFCELLKYPTPPSICTFEKNSKTPRVYGAMKKIKVKKSALFVVVLVSSFLQALGKVSTHRTEKRKTKKEKLDAFLDVLAWGGSPREKFS